MAYEGIEDLVIETTEGKTYTVVPEGVYDVQVTNISTITTKKFQSTEEENVFLFEFTIIEGEQKGNKVFRRIRPRLGVEPKESNLYKVACAILGKKLTKEDFPNFHISDLKDGICKVVVEITKKGDNEYSNVTNFIKAK